MTSPLDDALRWWARRTPETPALVMRGDRLAYRELDDWVDRTAHLIAGSGVVPGDRVGIIGDNSLEWCVAALATIRAGGIVAGMGQRLAAPEVAALVEQTTPTLLFAAGNQIAKMDEVLESGAEFTLADLDEVAALRSSPRLPFEGPVIDSGAPAVIVFTSGTSGLPKGAIFTHDSTLSLIFEWSLMESTFRHGVRFLDVLPLAPFGGLVKGVLQVIVHGGTLYLERRFEPAAALKILVEERINVYFGPPIVFQHISALSEFEHADLSALTAAMIGGAPVPVAELERWERRGASLRQVYGLTEAGGTITIIALDGAKAHPDRCGSGGVFRKLRTVRPDGSPCDPGELGEIVVRGPAVMPGYWNNDNASRETLVDGWLHTGDIGEFDEQGLLRVVDRMKDIIISGGYNIGPSEIERVIAGLPAVDEVAVIGVPDPKFGETPAAIVRLRGPLPVEDIVAHCNSHLADYKVPRYVVIADEPLPRNVNGKIMKPEIRKQHNDIPARLPRVR